MLHFNNKFFYRTEHFFKPSDHSLYHPEETSYCFIYEKKAEPDKKASDRGSIGKHSDCCTKYCCKSYDSIISIVQKCKTDAKTDNPVYDILKVDRESAVPYQTPEQSDHII